jgi:PDZ domain-containing protein
VLWIWPSNDFLLLPDKARPVAPLVDVHGGKNPTGPGGIYFDAIVIRRAKLFERLFPWIHNGATLVNEDLINPPGVSDKERRTEDLREMAQSQDVAAAVALKYLGYHVTIHRTGALIADVIPGTPAAKAHLEPTDVIVSVDGHPVRERTDLRPLIDAGSIGGPSAGLAFALEVVEELGHDVDHGYRVAATGEINLDGSVGSIGGVKQKILGVREAKVDVFLVPAGDNAKEARNHAGGVRVIPVKSFRQALHALATLPPKH